MIKNTLLFAMAVTVIGVASASTIERRNAPVCKDGRTGTTLIVSKTGKCADGLTKIAVTKPTYCCPEDKTLVDTKSNLCCPKDPAPKCDDGRNGIMLLKMTGNACYDRRVSVGSGKDKKYCCPLGYGSVNVAKGACCQPAITKPNPTPPKPTTTIPTTTTTESDPTPPNPTTTIPTTTTTESDPTPPNPTTTIPTTTTTESDPTPPNPTTTIEPTTTEPKPTSTEILIYTGNLTSCLGIDIEEGQGYYSISDSTPQDSIEKCVNDGSPFALHPDGKMINSQGSYVRYTNEDPSSDQTTFIIFESEDTAIASFTTDGDTLKLGDKTVFVWNGILYAAVNGSRYENCDEECVDAYWIAID